MVCRRVIDYEELEVALHLPKAIYIHPLSRPQVENYSTKAGKPLEGVRITLDNDSTLWELLKTPLMLDVAALTYQNPTAFVLRFLLWRYNYAPLNYVHFLDYAAERLFLRKVGGGYIFIHRMLLEYFASREPEVGKARPS